MQNVGLAGASTNPFVGFFGEAIGAFYDFHLLAVVRREIALKHLLKGGFNHLLLGG
jgi:hypothetical protein